MELTYDLPIYSNILVYTKKKKQDHILHFDTCHYTEDKFPNIFVL